MTTEVAPRASVIIPVLDDAGQLARCLRALDGQTFVEPFEVIVVDNGSCDDPASVVRGHARARLLHEPRRSSYAARNAGARSARGDILAFTDSDCIPAPDWLERGVECIQEADRPVFVGGPVDAFVRDPSRPTAVELYETLHAFPQRRYVEAMSFTVTANLIVARDAFRTVGDFDGSLQSGGDWHWGRRARHAGLHAVYAEQVRVAHPARRTIGEMSRKNRRRYAGQADLRALGDAPHRPAVLRRVAQPPLRSTLRNLGKLEPPTLRSKALYAGASVLLHYLSAYHQLRVAVRRREPASY